MTHVDALDFSEWHSEEVISFFWRSVYDLYGVFTLIYLWTKFPVRKKPEEKVVLY